MQDQKKYEPWIDQEYLCLLDRRKQAKMQWMQDPSQSNGENLNKVRRDASKHFRNKKKGYLKAKIEELENNSKIKNIRSSNRTPMGSLDSYPPGPKLKKWGCKKGAPKNGGLEPPSGRVIGLDGRVVSRPVRGLPVVFVVVRIGTNAVVRKEKKGLYTHEKFVHPWTCFVSVGLSSSKRACRRTVHVMTS